MCKAPVCTFVRLLSAADYVDFLNSVTPDNQDEFILQMRRFNLGPVGEADCPVFDGMFDYCAVRADRHTLLYSSISFSQESRRASREVLHVSYGLRSKCCC